MPAPENARVLTSATHGNQTRRRCVRAFSGQEIDRRMGWWRRWFGGQRTPAEIARSHWREAWTQAAAQPAEDTARSLKAQLDALGLPEEEVELEREMLEGLDALAALLIRLNTSGLPLAETGHRVIGGEPCHFSAVAFAPDEPDQPGGRLLLTPTRAVFVGGGRTIDVRWHSIVEVRQAQRDLLLIRVDRERLFRFQCNTHGDAMCAAAVARRLMPRRGGTL
jgi:hypothetical protein